MEFNTRVILLDIKCYRQTYLKSKGRPFLRICENFIQQSFYYHQANVTYQPIWGRVTAFNVCIPVLFYFPWFTCHYEKYYISIYVFIPTKLLHISPTVPQMLNTKNSAFDLHYTNSSPYYLSRTGVVLLILTHFWRRIPQGLLIAIEPWL